MNRKMLVSFIFVALLPSLSVAQTTKGQTDKKGVVNPEAQKIQKWGEATLTVKDEKGKVVLMKTEKYPILEPKASATATDFDNCWNFCRRVCDGYGVCWVSCGLHCSPWTR